MSTIPPPRQNPVPRTHIVSRTIVANWLATDGILRSHKVGLRWSPADPLAIRFRFPKRNDWYLARDLLFDALAKPNGAGDGDIRFSPGRGYPNFLILELENPKGYYNCLVRRRTLESFLAATISHECADPATELETWLAGANTTKRSRRKK